MSPSHILASSEKKKVGVRNRKPGSWETNEEALSTSWRRNGSDCDQGGDSGAVRGVDLIHKVRL